MKKLLKYGGLGLLGLIIISAILQGLGIIEPEEKETTSVMVTEQTIEKETTTKQESTTTIGNENLDVNSDEWKKITADWQQSCSDYEEKAMQDTADQFGITVEEVESIFFEDLNSDQTSFNVTKGTLVEATETSDNGLIIKVKIQPSYNNKATINQNYHNIEDIVKNQGGDKYEYIDYWAVADMADGSEGKVISFTVDKDLIQNIAEERIFAIELGDYVEDLWVLPSLLQ